jgi:poly-gamma-glutamate synthesis protein (capsule biosynthesis protein)
MLAAIADARRRADLVVVTVHWSRDFVATPTREQRRLAERMVEAGADVILGSGPHLIQRVDRVRSERGEAVVAYSLGNLVSPQGYQVRYGRRREGHRAAVHPGSRDGVVLRILMDVVDGRVTARELVAVPLWTRHDHMGPGRAPDIRVVPMGDAPEVVRRRRLPAIRRALGSDVELTPPVTRPE